jgi:hypothetical protein
MQGFYDVKGTEYNYSSSNYRSQKNFGLSTGILMRLEILFRR